MRSIPATSLRQTHDFNWTRNANCSLEIFQFFRKKHQNVYFSWHIIALKIYTPASRFLTLSKNIASLCGSSANVLLLLKSRLLRKRKYIKTTFQCGSQCSQRNAHTRQHTSERFPRKLCFSVIVVDVCCLKVENTRARSFFCYEKECFDSRLFCVSRNFDIEKIIKNYRSLDHQLSSSHYDRGWSMWMWINFLGL